MNSSILTVRSSSGIGSPSVIEKSKSIKLRGVYLLGGLSVVLYLIKTGKAGDSNI